MIDLSPESLPAYSLFVLIAQHQFGSTHNLASLLILISRQLTGVLQGIEINRDKDDNSSDKRVNVWRDASCTQPIADYGQKQDASECAGYYISPAAKQTGSADHDRSHRLKFHPPSGKRGDFAQVHGREKTANRSTQA